MAESVEFILKLNDQVSGAAKAAADMVRRLDGSAQAAQMRMRGVEDAARKINSAMDAAKTNTAAKALAAQARESSKAERAMRSMIRVQEQAQRMDAARARSSSLLGGLKAKLPFRSIADYATGAFVGEIAASAALGIGSAFVSAAASAVGVLKDGVKMAFVEGGKAEHLRVSYKNLLGEKGGADAMKTVSGFAGKTKYDDDNILTMMRPLFNAGLRGTGATTAFALASDASVRTGVDPNEVIADLAKIQNRGGITPKMLDSLKVSVSGFKDALSEETGIRDKESAFKKATEGKLDPMAIQNALVRSTEKRFGTRTGTATTDEGGELMSKIGLIQNLPSQYLKKMSDPSNPAWAQLTKTASGVLAQLDPDSANGKKIMTSLFGTFNLLAKTIERTFTADNIEKFSLRVSEAVAALQKLPAILDSVYRISRDVALIWTGAKFLNGVNAFAGGLQKGLAGNVAGNVVGASASKTQGVLTSAGGKLLAGGALTAGLGATVLPGLALGSAYAHDKAIDFFGKGQDEYLAKLKDDYASGRKHSVQHWYNFGGASDEDVADPAMQAVYARQYREKNAAVGNIVNVTIQGGINVSAAEGMTPEEQAKALGRHIEAHVSKALEKSATMSGGG